MGAIHFRGTEFLRADASNAKGDTGNFADKNGIGSVHPFHCRRTTAGPECSIYDVCINAIPVDLQVDSRELVTVYSMGGAASLGRVKHGKPITLQDCPGHEYEVEKADGTNLILIRVYLRDKKFYQISSIFPKSMTSSNALRFLDSFRFETNAVTR